MFSCLGGWINIDLLLSQQPKYQKLYFVSLLTDFWPDLNIRKVFNINAMPCHCFSHPHCGHTKQPTLTCTHNWKFDPREDVFWGLAWAKNESEENVQAILCQSVSWALPLSLYASPLKEWENRAMKTKKKCSSHSFCQGWWPMISSVSGARLAETIYGPELEFLTSRRRCVCI